ncbi:MAG: S8 family serine peptidase [Solirubrobacteraceae bacterium]
MSIVWGIRWDRRTHAALLAMVAGLVAAFALHSGPAPTGATADTTVIVRGGSAAERAITRAGGTVDNNLKSLGMIVASVPRDSIASLRKAPGVASVTPDAAVKLLDNSVPSAATTTMSDVRAAVADNGDGSGVDVALIDSGTVPVPALAGTVTGPDFSSDNGDSSLRGLDSFGHGTHIAGIIGGNDPSTGFQGVAPGARVVSVKVAATDGSTSLARLLVAFAWVVMHKDDNNMHVRVLNLSLGFRPETAYVNDVLSYAVEQTWKQGITVVASAGNSGATTTGLDSPAYDPYVIAVGADDTNGTAGVADDSIPDWSSKAADGRGPDVIAPGRAIVSLRVPGSFLDVNHPGGRISDTLFRGSGTSQAAGVVSGAAAVLIAKRPWLTPDQVKALLTSTADPIPGVDASAQGAGRIDIAGAASAAAPNASVVKQTFPSAQFPSDLARSLQGAKNGKNPAVSANGSLWSGSLWNGSLWSGSLWSGSLWSTYTDPTDA